MIDFFADCGAVEKVDWIIDKESGKFYGTVRACVLWNHFMLSGLC